MGTDLGWIDATTFAVEPDTVPPPDGFILWAGTVRHTGRGRVEPGRYRLLVQEHELYEVDPQRRDEVRLPALGRRLIYAETVPLDGALLDPPPAAATSTTP